MLPSSTYTEGGTTRRTSPELLDPERFGSETSCRTKPSDCYALGMVIDEVISGNMSFHGLPDLAVFQKALEGKRPPRKRGFTHSLWEILGRFGSLGRTPAPASRMSSCVLKRSWIPRRCLLWQMKKRRMTAIWKHFQRMGYTGTDNQTEAVAHLHGRCLSRSSQSCHHPAPGYHSGR